MNLALMIILIIIIKTLFQEATHFKACHKLKYSQTSFGIAE